MEEPGLIGAKLDRWIENRYCVLLFLLYRRHSIGMCVLVMNNAVLFYSRKTALYCNGYRTMVFTDFHTFDTKV